MSRPTPIGAVLRGLLAGAAGTAAMTAWQEASMKLQGAGSGSGSDSGDEHSESDPWEQASAPAQVGRKILEGVFDREVSADRIGLLTNVMHWAYGTSWGAVYGMVQSSRSDHATRDGLAFGTGVWAMSYVELVPMGLAEPPWKYPAKDMAMELSSHLVYGAAVAAAHAAMDR